MELDVEGDDAEPRLQIDLGVQTTSETKTGTSGAATGETPSAMTWLQAAEHVLREEGPGMHIRDLTRTILELGMVKSSCSTSLETLLYRQTSKGTSKFIRVPGKMGWFGLKGEGAGEQKPAIVLPSQAEQKVAGVVVEGRRGEGEDWDFRPKIFYKRKRASECSGSGSEESGWSSSSDEDSEALYHKKYIFLKKMAKGIIYENVALADQLSLIEHKISTAQAERNFLLQKLMKFERDRQVSSGKRSAPSTSSTTTTTATATTPATTPATAATTGPATPATADPVPTPSSAAAAAGSVVTLATGSVGAAKGGSPALSIPHLIHVSSLLQNRGGGGGGSNMGSELSATALLASKQSLATNLSLSSSLSALLQGPAEVERLGSEAAAVESPSHSGDRETELAGSRQLLSQKSLPQQTADTSSSVSSSSSSESDVEEEGTGGGGKGVKRKRGGGGGRRGGDSNESSGVKGGRSDEGVAKNKSGGGSVGKKKGSRQGRRLHPIPLKEDGSPVLPIQIGGLKVHKLGKIVYDRPSYHSERYLLPVGFESSRAYPSMQSPTRRTDYQCRILDGGDAPIFEMSAEDDPLSPIQASSSTACQTIVLKAINKARDRQATNSGSGPEFFGYSNPTILNLIQKLPNAGRCTKYKFNKFETPVRPVQKPRARKTAAGRHTGKTDGPRTKKKKLGTASRPFQSSSLLGGGGSGKRVGGGSGRDTQSEQDGATDPSLAPVLGSGLSQLGLEAGLGLYSSSDEWSSSDSEQEVTVDT